MTKEEELLTSFHFLPPSIIATLRSTGTDKALKTQTSDESTLGLDIIHEYQDVTEQRYSRSGHFGKTLTPSRTSVSLYSYQELLFTVYTWVPPS